MLNDAQKAAILKFQSDPESFFEKILGIDSLESYQRRILRAIVSSERLAISACHDVGKSWTLARIVLWYVSCFPYCKVITTAPTYNQVKNILWSEIRSAYSRSKFPLGGKMNLTEWQVTKEGDWFAIGFTPRNELSGEAGQGTQSSFQGFHAPHILVVFDEATGIPSNIWTMAEGMLTSSNVKFIAIGNPTSRNSEFYKCFHSSDWDKIELSCFDSPNLQANGITDKDSLIKELDIVRTLSDDDQRERLRSYKVVKPYLLSLRWVISMAHPRKWGIEHPLFVSKVLGEFPDNADNVLLPLGSVEESQIRVYYPTSADRRCIGVDVARFGDDSTVITILHGKKQLALKTLIKKSATEIVGDILSLAKEGDIIVVDETGVGGGVVDLLNENYNEGRLPVTCAIRGVQFGASPICTIDGCKHVESCDRAKYVNLKAKMFGHLKDDLRAHDGLALLPEDVYLEELPTIIYRYDSKGRLAIESKDDYKRRTGRRSPDYADSLALANFGRYDEISTGRFTEAYGGEESEFGKPFAAGLHGERDW